MSDTQTFWHVSVEYSTKNGWFPVLESRQAVRTTKHFIWFLGVRGEERRSRKYFFPSRKEAQEAYIAEKSALAAKHLEQYEWLQLQMRLAAKLTTT